MKLKTITMIVICLCLLESAPATIVFNDGQVHDIDWLIDTHVEVRNSPLGKATTINLLTNGIIHGELCVYDHSQANVLGGILTSGLLTNDDSRALVTGGALNYCLFVNHNSITTFQGNGFEIDGAPASYGVYTTNRREQVNGRLTGILANGDGLDCQFWITGRASIVLIPEPATLLLLGLGSLFLLRRR